MDWLTGLSGSPAPNLTALGCLVVLTVAAFALRLRGAGVGYAMMALAFSAVVVAKNAAYAAIVSGPHHENNLAARHDYARALLYVAIAQIVLGVIVGMITAGAQRVKWAAALAVFACGFAAASMLDWRSVYLHQPATDPVHFELHAAWMQGLLLIGMMGAAVVAIVSLSRRTRPRH